MADVKSREGGDHPGLLARLGAFWNDRRGNVAMMFGLAAIPFFAFGGLAVDYSRAMMVKNRLGDALDATALAIGGQLGLSEAEVTASANAYFKANYPDSEVGATSQLQITYAPAYVTISASAKVDTLIMGLLGDADEYNFMTVRSAVEVRREMKGLEVALVLDTTGSMGEGTKMPSLKQAANDLISILFGSNDFPEKLKVGIVPFAAAVKLDPQTAVNNGWIDTTGTSSIAKDYYDNNRFAYTMYAPLTGARQSWQLASTRKWTGCTEARPNGLEATDTPPTAANPDSRWVAYFQPDEPDACSGNGNYSGCGNYGYNYLSDGTTSSSVAWEARLKRTAKYQNVNVSTTTSSTGSNSGPYYGCGMQPVLALTNSRAAILARIASLNPSGNTHIPIGLGWGWRLLSPGEPFTEGVAYNDPETNKALILMTDGVNTISAQQSSTLKSTYSSYGYLYKGRLGTTSSSNIIAKMNDQVTTLCTNIKAVNIRVYTILLEEDDTTVRNLLRNCATNPSLFYDNVSASQLQQVFRVIGADLSNLRLAR